MTLSTALRRWLPVVLLLAVLGCPLVATPATAAVGTSAPGHIAEAVDSGVVDARQPQPSPGAEGRAAGAPGSSRGDAPDCADASSALSGAGESSVADVGIHAWREASITQAPSALAEARRINSAVSAPLGLTVAALSVRRT